jgi:diguanylate cyclase (GGDEF)-like protein/PAS domain S-box-containing protein
MKYLRLLQTAPALIRRAGCDAKSNWFNATWLAFSGRALAQEAGYGWMESLHPEDSDRLMQSYLDAFAERERFELEYRIRCHDGSFRWLLDHGIPVEDEDMRFDGYISYGFDITDRKTIEQSLFERTYELEVANAELERARIALEQLALFDALTGLANRHNFMQHFAREVARQKRNGAALSLLMIDVDHFKKANDLHGHAAGDACLKWLADVLTQNVRPTDVVGRFGGEEFLVLMPDADPSGALVAATRLCAVIRTRPAVTPMGPIPITVSIGGATSMATGPVGFDTILQRADAALYRAKSAGRDRVMMEGSCAEADARAA